MKSRLQRLNKSFATHQSSVNLMIALFISLGFATASRAHPGNVAARKQLEGQNRSDELSTAVAAPRSSPPARASLGEEGSNEVSFKLHRGYAIVVRGSVGDLKNLNFLVDTGTVPSVLDRRIAQALHLTGTAEKLSVLTKKLDSEAVVAPKLRVGPLQAETFRVLVRDLSFAEEALGTRIDALIGFDFFGQSPFTIDYKSKKIVFGPIDPSLTAIPYEAHPGYALVEMKLQQRTLRLLVDTGASDLILFASVASDYAAAIENVGTKTWSNMAGEFLVQKVHLGDAYLGSLPWGARDAFILPDGSPPAGLDGLLGVASLKTRRIALDPEHKRIAWERGQ